MSVILLNMILVTNHNLV